jgi:hypothetical protein
LAPIVKPDHWTLLFDQGEAHMSEATDETVSLECPHCRESTDSLKQFTIARWVLFALLYFSWTPIHYTACPSCTRKYILSRVALNLIPGNIAWPIFLVVSWGPQFARTFSSGHTRWIRKEITAGRITQETQLASAPAAWD